MLHIKLQQRTIEILIPCSKLQWIEDDKGCVVPHIKYVAFNMIGKENEIYNVKQEIQKHEINVLKNISLWWENNFRYLCNLQQIRKIAEKKKFNHFDCEYIVCLYSEFLQNINAVYLSNDLDWSNHIH